jgi:uncharacterized membrane protein YidH (DUF202 family)
LTDTSIATSFAIQFTEFHLDWAGAKSVSSSGEPAKRPASLIALVVWLAPFILVTGIVQWVCGVVPGLPDWA